MNFIQQLKKDVFNANMQLANSGLVILTWGNVSAIDRQKNIIAIKPSGVDYQKMKVDDIVVLDLSGKIIEGVKRPSVDTPTHLELYHHFKDIVAVVHTHSMHATAFAQAGKSIKCLGTTHADSFYGNIPVTRQLTKSELKDYEKNTGKIIAETFYQKKINPKFVPACLVKGHGVFSWGETTNKAIENSIIVEYVAKMKLFTRSINNYAGKLEKHMLDIHFHRKHGKNRYYGQNK